MQKQAPTGARLAVMIFFALSCFAILLFLWQSFGGPVPLGPKGYRFQVDFDEATTLGDNADVRISGVTVGSVIDFELEGRLMRTSIELESRYAPIPRDTKAIMRQKTLLGETYVELTPGDPDTGPLPDGAVLPHSQVRRTVELDEILRTFDPRTRRDLQRFLAAFARALKGRGEDLSDALGNAAPFARDNTDLLRVLDGQRDAVRRLVSDTGFVFGTLGRRQGELSGLVEAGDEVLRTTAHRDRELSEAVRILPTTLRELRPTLREVELLAGEAGPLVRELRPAARALGPALVDTAALAPDLRGLFVDVDRTITASRTALPAATRLLEAARPLVPQLDLLLAEALPAVDYLGLHRQELVTNFTNLAAATQAAQPPSAGAPPLHYLRALVPFGPESGVVADRRFGSNRHNPYFRPRALDSLATGLHAFDCQNEANPERPAPAPPCIVQRPLRFRGRATSFPHVRRDR